MPMWTKRLWICSEKCFKLILNREFQLQRHLLTLILVRRTVKRVAKPRFGFKKPEIKLFSGSLRY